VQSWLDNPSTNFGWLVQGDESDPMSVRRFALGAPDGAVPDLHVEFTPVPEPSSLLSLSTGALGLVLGSWRYRRRFAQSGSGLA
jgi:hypothetical protein